MDPGTPNPSNPRYPIRSPMDYFCISAPDNVYKYVIKGVWFAKE